MKRNQLYIRTILVFGCLILTSLSSAIPVTLLPISQNTDMTLQYHYTFPEPQITSIAENEPYYQITIDGLSTTNEYLQPRIINHYVFVFCIFNLFYIAFRKWSIANHYELLRRILNFFKSFSHD